MLPDPMTYAAQTSRYLENDVLSRSQEWLVPLMYEHLLASLRRAALQIQHGDLEGTAASLSRSTMILAELVGSLDFEKGGELASSLASLYSYFSLEILNAGRSMDVKVIERPIAMLSELHEARLRAAEEMVPPASGTLRTTAA